MYGDNCDCATRSLLGVREDTSLMKAIITGRLGYNQDGDHDRDEDVYQNCVSGYSTPKY